MSGPRLDPRLDNAPCGFLSFTEAGVVTAANRTLLELLGYDADEVLGGHVERLLTVGTRIFYQTHWFPLLRLHGRAEEIFLMLLSRTGEEVGVLVNAMRYEREGAVVYDCVLMRVRERQKYEDELLRARRAAEQARAEAEEMRAHAEEANRAKSEFLAVMSHELRTPLNAIAGYVDLLAMGIHGPVTEIQREFLGRIARSERHLLRLINDVLNLARLESRRVEYTSDVVDVAAAAASVAPMVEPQLLAKGVHFEAAVPGGLQVRADRDKTQQILLNLLGNAVKFTPSGGRVRVDAVVSPRDSGRVHVRVADTGIGIPATKLDSVFEPFVQVDPSHTRGEDGTGLGLAISRDLARGMGGDLWAESTLGAGSTFTLSLPRA